MLHKCLLTCFCRLCRPLQIPTHPQLSCLWRLLQFTDSDLTLLCYPASQSAMWLSSSLFESQYRAGCRGSPSLARPPQLTTRSPGAAHGVRSRQVMVFLRRDGAMLRKLVRTVYCFWTQHSGIGSRRWPQYHVADVSYAATRFIARQTDTLSEPTVCACTQLGTQIKSFAKPSQQC